MWRKIGFVARGTYAVFPLSPEIVMYCHEREYWKKLGKFDCSLSPVELSTPMVQHENSGQVYMVTRFVISPVNDFAFAREFARTIGTDAYAPPELKGKLKLDDPEFLAELWDEWTKQSI